MRLPHVLALGVGRAPHVVVVDRVSAIVEAARHYHADGWALVPLFAAPGGVCTCRRTKCTGNSRGKHPVAGAGWQHVRYTLADLPGFAGGNLGVLLGPASGELVDIDLDCREAIKLADAVFPATLTFGRASKPRSHRLYRSPGARMKQFRMPDGKETIVELRAHPEDGEGAQTVIPPSVHVSGEAIAWDPDDGRDALELPDAAIELDAVELLERVTRLAIASVVMRCADEHAARCFLLGGKLPALPARALARLREWVHLPPVLQPAKAAVRQVWGDVVDRARRYLAASPPAVQGEHGSDRTFVVAQHLVHGFALDDETALRLLTEWNARCVPPWSEGELHRKIRHARERGTTVTPGAHLGGHP